MHHIFLDGTVMGYPSELQVEKKMGKSGGKLDRKAFRQACREYAHGQINIQKEAFIRLGVFGDWDQHYATMDRSYEACQVRVLAKIVEQGHIERGFKPVHWCLDCQSALAEAELEYKNKQSDSIDVRFQVVDSKIFLQCFMEDTSDYERLTLLISNMDNHSLVFTRKSSCCSQPTTSICLC